MADIDNRRRLIKLMQLLERETDEESSLSKEEIISKLKNEFEPDQFKVNIQSIVKDIRTLTSCGFEVITEKGEKNKTLYSNKNKLFELYELRILIDAISSARFITKEETRQIINKIKKLTGTTLAKKLQNQIYVDGRIKANNNQVRRFIDMIHTAISAQKKVSFKYGKYNTNKEFSIHRNGEYYQVDPYNLVWNNDYYYLVGILYNEESFRNFRVDRMRDVKIDEISYKKREIIISDYINESFNMYPGQSEMIKIRFKTQLINAVLDRLGTDTPVYVDHDNNFEIRFKAVINEGLVRWILMWGGDAKVLYPKTLVDKLQNVSKEMQELYNG